MHDDRVVIEKRIRRVLRERIEPAVYPHALPLAVEAWSVPAERKATGDLVGEPVPVADALRADYAPVTPRQSWGAPWATVWFRVRGTVPAAWRGRTVEAVLDLGFTLDRTGFQCEGLVYRADGTAVKGLNPSSQWVRVSAAAAGDEQVELYVEAAANPEIHSPYSDKSDRVAADSAPIYQLGRMDLAVFDDTVWQLVRDIEVLDGVMRELPTDSARRWEILLGLNKALDELDLDDVNGSAARVRSALSSLLAAPAAAHAHRITAVGHAHIDSAWLWPQRETIRKVARTAANVTALMDDDPEFVFAMSQAQQLAWIQQHRPEVFERVKDKIAGGQFVPVGGMWVESDTNMPGGEAMARQFVYGKRYYAEQFGIETEEVWLPDSFGYSAALPQLIKLSGAKWFLTQKISWSQVNKFPHHTFWWEGIDGTRIFTHFPPVDTYNCKLSAAELAHASSNFQEKGAASRSLAPFGYGDGGGGPTREMLARASRFADLDGAARVRIARPSEFFEAAHAEYPDAPVWYGELYLETHRGTYTSQLRTKQSNRRGEALLREAELWAATAAIRTGAAYPYDRIDQAWRTLLLHQFHDILPGSSITWVYREATWVYAEMLAHADYVVETAQRALAGPEEVGTTEVVFNGSPFGRAGVPAGGAALVAADDSADAAGAAGTADASDVAPVTVRARDEGGYVIDNALIRVVVDAAGHVASAVDLRTGRDAVAPGQIANELQLHADFPVEYEAWDIDVYYRNTVRSVTDVSELTIADARPRSCAIRVLREVGASRIEQLIMVNAGARRVEFELVVDWHERQKLLKAAFPLDVRAAVSSAETQFGHVDRPTHRNTSWEAAKFEICAHRFLHVGEPGWGAALVNDSTYGHDVTRDVRADGGTTTTVRLSLLRAPLYPDPVADQGQHMLRYALVPGADIGDAVREGWWFNQDERRLPGDRAVDPLVRVPDDDGVVVSAVKLADDQSGDLVVRLYEAQGRRVETRLSVHAEVTGAVETDLLERPLAGGERWAAADGAELAVGFRPFQIRTLRFSRS